MPIWPERLKYNFSEARYVLERASARESAARVAVGGLAKLLLRELGIEVLSHVVAVGAAVFKKDVSWEQIRSLSELNEVLLNCADSGAEQQMKEEVDKVLRTGDSVGGIFEVVAHSVPPGLGTYAQWDERFDGQFAGCSDVVAGGQSGGDRSRRYCGCFAGFRRSR